MWVNATAVSNSTAHKNEEKKQKCNKILMHDKPSHLEIVAQFHIELVKLNII